MLPPSASANVGKFIVSELNTCRGYGFVNGCREGGLEKSGGVFRIVTVIR